MFSNVFFSEGAHVPLTAAGSTDAEASVPDVPSEHRQDVPHPEQGWCCVERATSLVYSKKL